MKTGFKRFLKVLKDFHIKSDGKVLFFTKDSDRKLVKENTVDQKRHFISKTYLKNFDGKVYTFCNLRQEFKTSAYLKMNSLGNKLTKFENYLDYLEFYVSMKQNLIQVILMYNF